MAVVMEMKASNGAAVRIHDDAYAGISAEKMRKRQNAVIECAKKIAISAEIRKIREAHKSKEN